MDERQFVILRNTTAILDPDGGMMLFIAQLPSERLPKGFYLVHNSVRPTRSFGSKGFRAWVTHHREPHLVACKCNFARLKNAKINRHYRVPA